MQKVEYDKLFDGSLMDDIHLARIQNTDENNKIGIVEALKAHEKPINPKLYLKIQQYISRRKSQGAPKVSIW
jgi:hypothetical protein